MIDQLTRNWWAPALRGALALLFGIVAFLSPLTTVAALILFFGAFALADGLMSLVLAARFSHQDVRWGALLFEGLLGVLVGLLALFFPVTTAISLVYLAAAWAVVTGVLQIITAVRLRKEIEGEWLMALGGVASVLLGFLLFLLPGAGVIAWAWMLGAYAVIAGVMLLGLAFRLRGLHRRTPLRPQASM